MFDDVGGYVEGEMSVPGSRNINKLGEPDFNTLDEPIKDTFVKSVLYFTLCFLV